MKRIVKKIVKTKAIVLIALVLNTFLLTGCLFLEEDEPVAKLDLASGDYACVTLSTNMGDMIIALDEVNAPITVANFLSYTNDLFYNGTIVHRVIDGFMIQAGGFNQSYDRKTTGAPITNEAHIALSNKRGTISMARTDGAHSATAQFFINTVDNLHLDYKAATNEGWGHAAFGQVVNGMSLVDSISKVTTGPGGPFDSDVPTEMITIETASVVSCDDVVQL